MCSVTSVRYGELRQQVTATLREMQHLQTTAFMQDGAPPRIWRQVKEQIHANFCKNHVISRGFPDAWHPCTL